MADSTILTADEAAAVLRCGSDDASMLSLLPMVDAYINNATGRDWTQDDTIYPEAKSAARMLVVQWFENPAMWASGVASLDHGLAAALTQLEVKALELEEEGS